MSDAQTDKNGECVTVPRGLLLRLRNLSRYALDIPHEENEQREVEEAVLAIFSAPSSTATINGGAPQAQAAAGAELTAAPIISAEYARATPQVLSGCAVRAAAQIVDAAELVRLREIEHFAWHVLESCEHRVVDNELVLDLPDADYDKLCALLGDCHPEVFEPAAVAEGGKPVWIPVGEAAPTPENGAPYVPVLFVVRDHENPVCAGRYLYDAKTWAWVSLQGATFKRKDVTHWMPLPDAPSGPNLFGKVES